MGLDEGFGGDDAVFGTEGGEAGVVQAVAADEIDDDQEQEGAEDHDGSGGLQTDLKIAHVGNFTDEERAERA